MSRAVIAALRADPEWTAQLLGWETESGYDPGPGWAWEITMPGSKYCTHLRVVGPWVPREDT